MSDRPAPPTVESPATEPRHSLWQAFARSVRDNVFAEIALQTIRVGGIVVLARALVPTSSASFGCSSWSPCSTLTNRVRHSGSAVQRRNLPRHESTGWCLSMRFRWRGDAALFDRAAGCASMLMPGIEPYSGCYAFRWCSRAPRWFPTRGCGARCASARSPPPRSSRRWYSSPSRCSFCGADPG